MRVTSKLTGLTMLALMVATMYLATEMQQSQSRVFIETAAVTTGR